jgi:dTDP-4-amino-4,6-dideoxygalactose transaminase
MVDVDKENFLIDLEQVKEAISSKTKAIVPVHLFGQCANMEELLKLTEGTDIAIVEDNAQAIGADYFFSSGSRQKSGTIGHFGCTSFFPSKNLGCFGDGGAICTNDEALAIKAKMIASHGQSKQYVHDVVGCNSRLDAIQAAVLRIKLKYLDEFNSRRNQVAERYDNAFREVKGIAIPSRVSWSDHVFHQYTLVLNHIDREALRQHLAESDIPSMIYYPIPLHKQKAFESSDADRSFGTTEYLCDNVLSLPIHTEMDEDTQKFIIEKTLTFIHKSK